MNIYTSSVNRKNTNNHLDLFKLRGFTLIETIVVISITALILVTLGGLLAYFYKTNSYALEQSVATSQARRGIEDSTYYLREASYGNDGSYPIALASTSTITFFANIDTDPSIERVTYTREGDTLYRVVAKTLGNTPTYVGATISTTTVARSVINNSSTPIFRYFDDTGTELSLPVDISKISSVKTTLIIDVNVNRTPVSFTLSSGATLRNLKTQL